jgi:type II secretory pathway pseudopilin PulG
MKKLLNNHQGITLIETVVSVAIIAIIVVTVLGALLYGQKMVVFSDTKNGAATKAQEIIDDRMNQITTGSADASAPANEETTIDGYQVEIEYAEANKDKDSINEGCNIVVRVYYNNNASYTELTAYALKGGVGL